MLRITFRVFVIGLMLAAATAAQAGATTELAEWMIKQGAKFSDDVAGKSSKELAVELEKLSTRAGGNAVEQLVKKGGPGVLKTVRGLGDRAPDAVRLISRFGEAGTLAVEQSPGLAVDAFRQFGDDGVRVLVRQGAVKGGEMLSVYGRPLAEAADRLSPQSLADLRHWLPEVEKAPTDWRSAFTGKLSAGSDDFVVWAHHRWKELATLGGLTVAGITAYKVGDGVADTTHKVGDAVAAAMPNPAADPGGWLVWWLPALAIVAMLSGAWVAPARSSRGSKRARSTDAASQYLKASFSKAFQRLDSRDCDLGAFPPEYPAKHRAFECAMQRKPFASRLVPRLPTPTCQRA